jgi:hypothetical protein
LDGFSGNSELTEVIIPATVETIKNGAFSNCFNLEKVEFEKVI